MDVSVVVPTHNRERQLQRLLYSLERLETIRPRDVVVVDDGSKDRTWERLLEWTRREHAFAAKALRIRESGGPGRARNHGITATSGRVIAFTDDDCIVHPKWLDGLLRPYEGDESVVGVGGSVLPQDGDFYSRFYTFHHILEPPEGLDYLVTANCCYKREALDRVGGFEGDIPVPGGEDVGLSFKIRLLNGRLAFAPAAIVYHGYRRGLKDVYRTFRNYGRGCRFVVDRYCRQREVGS